MYYQDQLHPLPREIRAPASPNTRNTDNSDPGPGTQIQQQAKDSNYILPQHLDQHYQHQQYVQAGAHYVHHHAASPVTMPQYYQVYPQTPQQFHHPIDQQYPVYIMPVAPQTPQPYNMSLQSNIADATTVVTSSRPLTTPAPASGIPPVYPAKAASPTPPEMAASGVYKTTMASNAPLVQIPQNQFQQNYMGFSQMHHHPTQSLAIPSSAAGNYAFEYSNPASAVAHEQVFYTQHPAAVAAPSPLPSQYQSMTPAAAIALSEAAKQLPADNTNAQQQNRTSQPL
ncbi:hypothetical protein L484_000307 [Morus notabilis]|uniref:Uncharacterized protein n=1 Tax=Morus notabilis TaxID=981085 RepID=W9SP70_9ROSA|nr:uncharacterized protein LOC21383948 [Morus notabilis]EXC42960.1 hypothetical protein L484_000307 [Morus notabilis]